VHLLTPRLQRSQVLERLHPMDLMWSVKMVVQAGFQLPPTILSCLGLSIASLRR
jgi:hypothetical protein